MKTRDEVTNEMKAQYEDIKNMLVSHLGNKINIDTVQVNIDYSPNGTKFKIEAEFINPLSFNITGNIKI